MNNLLLEKSISHLYENGRMTIGKLKEKIKLSSMFNLKEDNIVEGKELLLSYSINENKLLISDKKTNIKQNSKSIKEYIKTLQENKESCYGSLSYLEENINRMSSEEQKDIFGDTDKIYYKIKVLYFPDDGQNYNTNFVSTLEEGHCQYDQSGKLILTELVIKLNKFNSYLREWQKRSRAEKYINESVAYDKLLELYNKEYVNIANNNINNSLNTVNSYINNDNFKLSDDSSINDYMLSRTYVLLNSMLDNSKFAPYDSIAKMNIAKKILGVNGISYYDLNKVLNPEQMYYIKDNVLNHDSRKEFLNTAIKPLENTLIEYAINILKSSKSILLLENSVNYKSYNKILENRLKFIESNKSLKTLKNELMNLRFIDRQMSKKKKPIYYDGKKCILDNNYKPIKELLNLLSPINENAEKQIITEKVLNGIILENIQKRNNKYCLISKKSRKNLGCYSSLDSAKKREKQVSFFKNKTKKESSSVAGGDMQASVINNLEPEQR